MIIDVKGSCVSSGFWMSVQRVLLLGNTGTSHVITAAPWWMVLEVAPILQQRESSEGLSAGFKSVADASLS